mmetsp:Transcript_34502/g.48048  ORF Transcript_34502/g.48048 Transcript_34502/m.48048 type:complete len:123 (+) Transcript_34502:68-436(+)
MSIVKPGSICPTAHTDIKRAKTLCLFPKHLISVFIWCKTQHHPKLQQQLIRQASLRPTSEAVRIVPPFDAAVGFHEGSGQQLDSLAHSSYALPKYSYFSVQHRSLSLPVDATNGAPKEGACR